MSVCFHSSKNSQLDNSTPKGMFGLSHQHNPFDKRNHVGKTFCSVGVCPYGGTVIESHVEVVEEKVGVLLLNLGGPETLNDVQPFLFNLFADPVC